MAETEQPPNYGGYPNPCILYDCENSTSCNVNCVEAFFPIPLPPPPPPPPPSASQPHFAPFLIAIVCVLGISFFLLTTCTIILRIRFTRRRQGGSPANSGVSSINDDDHTFVDHPIWHITTVGLQQSVIDSITAFKYKKIDGFFVGENDSSCSVCLTEFEDGDDLRLLPKCSHAFHVPCIDTWLRSHKNCPLCRAPIVNESFNSNSVVEGVISSSNSGLEDEVLRVNLDDHDDVSNGGEGSSDQLSERGDDVVGRLPVLEGIKVTEILNKNHELRVFSDLGVNHRFQGVEDDEGLEPVRRSISFNGVVASSKCEALMGNEGCPREVSSSKCEALMGNEGCPREVSFDEGCSREGSFSEGCSKDGYIGDVLQEKKVEVEKEGKKKGSSMSGELMKSSSSGQSLQKGPVSMKRSLSSSSKFFSFRRSKSQASVLPL